MLALRRRRLRRHGIAGAAVADLGEQGGGADDRGAIAKETAEDLPVGMRVQAGGDPSVELDDLADDDLQRSDERERDTSSAAGLCLAGATRGGTPQPLKLRRCPGNLRLLWFWALRNAARRFSPSNHASSGLG